jgi:hypothetical protein
MLVLGVTCTCPLTQGPARGRPGGRFPLVAGRDARPLIGRCGSHPRRLIVLRLPRHWRPAGLFPWQRMGGRLRSLRRQRHDYVIQQPEVQHRPSALGRAWHPLVCLAGLANTSR